MKRLHTKLQNKNKGKAPYVRVLCTRFTPYVTDYYSPFKVIHTNQQGTPDHIWSIQGCMTILAHCMYPARSRVPENDAKLSTKHRFGWLFTETRNTDDNTDVHFLVIYSYTTAIEMPPSAPAASTVGAATAWPKLPHAWSLLCAKHLCIRCRRIMPYQNEVKCCYGDSKAGIKTKICALCR